VQERDETSALLLLRLQARPDTVDRLGLTPLFYAARDGNKRLVQALLAAGAYRSLRNCNSWIRQAHFMAEIRDSSIVAIIQSATVTCPRLTWLARLAFRSYAKEHSSSFTRRLNYPSTLVQFIDFEDINQDWMD
jgi:ankyrin repeat protein